MTYDKHITLTRSDLLKGFSDLPPEMISLRDFSIYSDKLEMAETVIFRDAAPARRTIILKDRHGIFGNTDTDCHIIYGLMIYYATVYPKYREFVEMILGKQLTWEESK